jgi:FkbM family methyltransferase
MSTNPHFRRSHFSLEDRMISFISEKLFENLTYTVRHGLIKGMKRKGGLGFLPAVFSRSSQNEIEEAFLGSLDLKGKVVYDIGAFQGIMTLFFARQARAVVTYEPHPANYQRVLENVQLNALQNVVILNRALGDRESTLTLVYDPRMPGAATGDPAISAQIRSSLAQPGTTTVPVVCLDDDLTRHDLPRPDFVKIDVEGMELAVLRGMQKALAADHPVLYLEMHGATEDEKRRKAREIIEFLSTAGYRCIRHIETGTTVTTANSAVANQGHMYCTLDADCYALTFHLTLRAENLPRVAPTSRTLQRMRFHSCPTIECRTLTTQSSNQGLRMSMQAHHGAPRAILATDNPPAKASVEDLAETPKKLRTLKRRTGGENAVALWAN